MLWPKVALIEKENEKSEWLFQIDRQYRCYQTVKMLFHVAERRFRQHNLSVYVKISSAFRKFS
jgi:hypothetical protein